MSNLDHRLKFLVLALFAFLGTGQLHAADKTDTTTEEGIAAFEAGKYDLALEKYSAALKENPKNAIAYNDRGLVWTAKKDYTRAVADFTAALRLRQDWYFFYNRGVAHSEGGDEKSAIADFTKALQKAPLRSGGHANCLVARARSYFGQEETEPAMTDLNAAIKLGVKAPDAFVLRGILRKIQHDYTASLTDYEKAIALDADDARSYNCEAYLLAACPAPKYRDGRKAVVYASKACELSQWKAADCLETLAAAYAENREFEKAVTWQEIATRLDPTAVDSQRLALYQQKKPFRDLNRKEQPIADVSDLPDKVSIKIGQQLSIQFQERGDTLVAPEITSGTQRRARSLLLNFHLEKKQCALLIEPTFWRTVQGRCLARLVGYDTYFETDILPVKVGTIGRELWPDSIEELVLFDLKLTGPSQEPTPAEGDSQVASLAADTGRAFAP